MLAGACREVLWPQLPQLLLAGVEDFADLARQT